MGKHKSNANNGDIEYSEIEEINERIARALSEEFEVENDDKASVEDSGAGEQEISISFDDIVVPVPDVAISGFEGTSTVTVPLEEDKEKAPDEEVPIDEGENEASDETSEEDGSEGNEGDNVEKSVPDDAKEGNDDESGGADADSAENDAGTAEADDDTIAADDADNSDNSALVDPDDHVVPEADAESQDEGETDTGENAIDADDADLDIEDDAPTDDDDSGEKERKPADDEGDTKTNDDYSDNNKGSDTDDNSIIDDSNDNVDDTVSGSSDSVSEDNDAKGESAASNTSDDDETQEATTDEPDDDSQALADDEPGVSDDADDSATDDEDEPAIRYTVTLAPVNDPSYGVYKAFAQAPVLEKIGAKTGFVSYLSPVPFKFDFEGAAKDIEALLKREWKASLPEKADERSEKEDGRSEKENEETNEETGSPSTGEEFEDALPAIPFSPVVFPGSAADVPIATPAEIEVLDISAEKIASALDECEKASRTESVPEADAIERETSEEKEETCTVDDAEVSGEEDAEKAESKEPSLAAVAPKDFATSDEKEPVQKRGRKLIIVLWLIIILSVICIAASIASVVSAFNSDLFSPDSSDAASYGTFSTSEEDAEMLLAEGYDAIALQGDVEEFMEAFLTYDAASVENGSYKKSYSGYVAGDDDIVDIPENLIYEHEQSDWKEQFKAHPYYRSELISLSSISWAILPTQTVNVPYCDVVAQVECPPLEFYMLNSPALTINRYESAYRIVFDESGKIVSTKKTRSTLIAQDIDPDATEADVPAAEEYYEKALKDAAGKDDGTTSLDEPKNDKDEDDDKDANETRGDKGSSGGGTSNDKGTSGSNKDKPSSSDGTSGENDRGDETGGNNAGGSSSGTVAGDGGSGGAGDTDDGGSGSGDNPGDSGEAGIGGE